MRSGEIVLAEAHAAAILASVESVTTHLMRGRPERVIIDLATPGVTLVSVSPRP